MYNIDFLPQLEEARRHLFGGIVDPLDSRNELAEKAARYLPPPDIKFIECHEDVNGEWVPNHVPALKILEGRTDAG